jgi:flavodoxin
MRIGIIVYSRTGNTLSVSERIRESLLAGGHEVQLERVTAINEDPNTAREKIKLKSIPDIALYDYVIMGAPVQGFSLSPIMKTYLDQIPQLQGKKVACFVTQHFPKPWMGGSHALKQMVGFISQKGGKVTDTGNVNWTSKVREEQINELRVRLCRI